MKIGKRYRVNRGDTAYTVYQATISRWYVVDVFETVESSVRREKAYLYLDMPNWMRDKDLMEEQTEKLFLSLDDAIQEASRYVGNQVSILKRSEK